jgi:glycosyltransferase involved in cell wall biosynthesis
MISIGYVYDHPSQEGVYRGIDAYSSYLWKNLENIKHPDLKIHQITLKDLSDSRFDLYHFPSFNLFHPSFPVTFHSPCVITLHDATRLEFSSHYPLGIRGNLNLVYQKYFLARAKLIITDSFSSIRQIQKFLSLPAEKMRMVYLAAPDNFRIIKSKKSLQQIKKKYQLPDKYILCNGDIDWNKNLTGLVKSCNSSNISLVLYGKSPQDLVDHPEKYDFGHPELAHLPALRQSLLKENIHLLGFIPDSDLVGIFNLANLYCQPSFAEGFGLPVLQAMACGIPVACSNTHSLPEIAGKAAKYFDPNDIDSITKTIVNVLEDQTLRQELITQGLKQAEKYSWSKTATNTINIYQEALSL